MSHILGRYSNFLICFFGLYLIQANFFFALGLPLQLFSFVLTYLVVGFLFRRIFSYKIQILSFVGLISIAFFFSFSYDLSADGLGYHKVAIDLLAKGWNPLKEMRGQILIDHYSTGNWILSVGWVQIFQRIATASAVNIFFIICAWGSAYRALLLSGLIHRRAVLVATLAALNPIALSQVGTSYVDGNVISMCICALSLFVLYLRDRDVVDLISLIASLLILSTLKFTGILQAGLFAMFALGYLLLLKKLRRLELAAFTVLLLATLLCNWHPLFRNYTRHGHVFYPILGDNKINIMKGQIPPGFKEMGSIQKFFVSHLSVTSNLMVNSGEPTLKIPGTFRLSEFGSAQRYDVRIGGFGPWFSISVLLSFLLILLSNERKPVLLGMLIFLTFWAIINPGAWWARYSPQFYLVALLGLLTTVHGACKIHLKNLLIVFLILNNLAFGLGSIGRTLKHSGRGYKAISKLNGINQIILFEEQSPNAWKRYLEEQGLQTSYGDISKAQVIELEGQTFYVDHSGSKL